MRLAFQTAVLVGLFSMKRSVAVGAAMRHGSFTMGRRVLIALCPTGNWNAHGNGSNDNNLRTRWNYPAQTNEFPATAPRLSQPDG